MKMRATIKATGVVAPIISPFKSIRPVQKKIGGYWRMTVNYCDKLGTLIIPVVQIAVALLE